MGPAEPGQGLCREGRSHVTCRAEPEQELGFTAITRAAHGRFDGRGRELIHQQKILQPRNGEPTARSQLGAACVQEARAGGWVLSSDVRSALGFFPKHSQQGHRRVRGQG